MAVRAPVRLAYEVRAMTEKGDSLDSIILTKGMLSRIYRSGGSWYRVVGRLESNGWVTRNTPFTWRPTSQLKEFIARTACDVTHQTRI